MKFPWRYGIIFPLCKQHGKKMVGALNFQKHCNGSSSNAQVRIEEMVPQLHWEFAHFWAGHGWLGRWRWSVATDGGHIWKSDSGSGLQGYLSTIWWMLMKRADYCKSASLSCVCTTKYYTSATHHCASMHIPHCANYNAITFHVLAARHGGMCHRHILLPDIDYSRLGVD